MTLAASRPLPLSGNKLFKERQSDDWSQHLEIMKIRLLSLAFIFLTLPFFSTSQVAADPATSSIKKLRVGVFAPLYLDSVFSADGKFRFKQGMPRFIVPAVDFVNGAQIALDSLNTNSNQVQAFIYDTKAYKASVDHLIKTRQLDSLNLLIGSVKDVEYLQLAEFARAKNIPFISATYPNDGGINTNPYLVVINSTLKAHCEAIYGFLLQNHGADKVFLVRKKGAQEDKVASYFKTINEPDGKPLLNIQVITADSITSAILKKRLDTTRQSIIVGGSLDETFATSLTEACYELREDYSLTLVGMPNWDGFKNLVKKDRFTDFPIYFTTPYFNNKWDDYSKMLTNGFAKKYKGKPSDMAFKGFETTYLFTRLLMAYSGDMMNHLNDRTFKLFSDYNFRPVLLKRDNVVPDYFENKHLYFIQIMNGATSRAW